MSRLAWVGIDVAVAKGKALPVCVVTREDGVLQPLSLLSTELKHPVGTGNPSMLDSQARREFALRTADYLKSVERYFQVDIQCIAIDAPREPAESGRRACERGLDALNISCYPTPSIDTFDSIIKKGQRHLASGGPVARLPNGFQLWMLAGFELFSVLGRQWECLEVYPHAIVRQLGVTGRHKSKLDGYQEQLNRVAQQTGWEADRLSAHLKRSVRGDNHDKLDAYMSAWVASLYPDSVEACGEPLTDVIWLPDVRTSEHLTLDKPPASRVQDAGDEFCSGGGKTTQIGYINRNSQICWGSRGVPGNDHCQVSYKLECRHCGEHYGANGSDIFHRKCPACQSGAPGIAY